MFVQGTQGPGPKSCLLPELIWLGLLAQPLELRGCKKHQTSPGKSILGQSRIKAGMLTGMGLY